jgi:DNA-binding response OmpR family regulator
MAKEPLILLVEDDPDILSLFAGVFRMEGFRVERAPGGWEATNALGQHVPDGVILDMAMPGKSGLSVLRDIRLDPKLKHLPVIVVSAVSPDHDLYSGVEPQWDEYLQKPVDVHVVVKTMRALLERGKKSAKKPAAKKAAAKPKAKSKSAPKRKR